MKVIVTTITRSPKGNPMRSSREINADQVRIGRGAECELRLADPRVPLHARTIFLGRHGAQLYEAFEQFTDASITGVHRPQNLRPGMSVRIGPFQIDVTEAHHGADLALSVELVQALPGKSSISAQEIYEQARRSPVSRRALSWLLFAGILGFFLLLPGFFQGGGSAPASRDARFLQDLQGDAGRLAQVAWNPGKLAAGHQPFAHDCKACHSDSFTRVQDKDCKTCHQNLGDHVSAQTGKVPGLSEVRCATCHRDHKGTQALRAQIDHQFMGECSSCHGDIKRHLPTSKTGNTADFADRHPQFRATLITGLDAHGKPATARVRLSDKDNLREKRGLRFPHDIHLDARGIDGPQGREKLECASCHTPDGTGLHLKPVTMKQHCQSCHELRFELAAPERQVPHGNVDDVIRTMREFYSYLAVNGIVLNEPQDGAVPLPERAVPGKPAPTQRRLAGKVDVEAQVLAAATEIFERTTCFTCHEIQRVEAEGAAPTWKVSPVIPALATYMPRAKFSHARHDMMDCKGCHAAAGSMHARDVMLPKIESCRECHAGNHPESQKITSNCGMCHGFHQVGHAAVLPAGGSWPSARDAALLKASTFFAPAPAR